MSFVVVTKGPVARAGSMRIREENHRQHGERDDGTEPDVAPPRPRRAENQRRAHDPGDDGNADLPGQPLRGVLGPEILHRERPHHHGARLDRDVPPHRHDHRHEEREGDHGGEVLLEAREHDGREDAAREPGH